MPCFSCKCFRDGRGRNGEYLSAGMGYCELWDQEFFRGHECRSFAPVWNNPSQSGDPLKEPNGCFLSSACVDYLGFPDDCKELTVLRSFRDNVLKKSAQGAALVDEYYKIAPDLVVKINASSVKNEIYQNIYNRILLCVDDIEHQKYDSAVLRYREMVDYVTKAVLK